MPTGSNQDIPEVIPFFHSEVLPLLCLSLSLCPNASEMADSLVTETQIGFALLIYGLHLFSQKQEVDVKREGEEEEEEKEEEVTTLDLT